MPNKISFIHIPSIKLAVNLGWQAIERKKKQLVFLDIKINFVSIPKACQSDELQDTYCYAKLIHSIENSLSDKNYHLIECLAADIYELIKKEVVTHHVQVSIKKFPEIASLSDGVSFTYGDCL